MGKGSVTVPKSGADGIVAGRRGRTIEGRFSIPTAGMSAALFL
jgi:hypothetical protein